MTVKEYTLDEVRLELDRRLDESLKGERRAAVIQEAAIDVIIHHHPQAEQRRLDADLFSKDRHFAVPDASLKLVESIVASSLSFFITSPAAALPGLVTLFLRYQQLKVEVNGDEVLVLRALKRAKTLGKPGQTVVELAAAISGQRELTQDEVRNILEGLLRKSRAAPSEVTLLEQSENGRWRIGNV
ncbi:MAG: hypothetical protein RMA76_46155 [Deltaproteobacteria bacterium]|jgi:hypothetical protein